MTADRRARTQYTICDDCGNTTLEHNKAVWTTDGASYCPTCRPMTADRAELVEKVARAMAVCEGYDANNNFIVGSFEDSASAAIDLIRAEVLEEAAKVADAHVKPIATDLYEGAQQVQGRGIAAAIRALAAPSGAMKEKA